MNDVQGNYSLDKTSTTTKNSDMNNHYVASTVAKNNTETSNATIGTYPVNSRNAPAEYVEGIGNGNLNTITFGNSRTAFNGMY